MKLSATTAFFSIVLAVVLIAARSAQNAEPGDVYQKIEQQRIQVQITQKCDIEKLFDSSDVYKGFELQTVSYHSIETPFPKRFNVANQPVRQYIRPEEGIVFEAKPILNWVKYDDPTIQSLRESLNSEKTKYKFAGNTGTAIRYNIPKKALVFDDTSKLYKIDMNQFRVQLSFEVTLPNWIYVDTATGADKLRWNSYLCDLARHEKKHVEISRSFAVKGLRSTRKLRAQSKRELVSQYKKIWKINFSDRKLEQAKFDAETNHGPRL